HAFRRQVHFHGRSIVSRQELTERLFFRIWVIENGMLLIGRYVEIYRVGKVWKHCEHALSQVFTNEVVFGCTFFFWHPSCSLLLLMCAVVRLGYLILLLQKVYRPFVERAEESFYMLVEFDEVSGMGRL